MPHRCFVNTDTVERQHTLYPRMSPFLSGSGTSNQRTRMLLEVVAKAETLVGPHRGTGGEKGEHYVWILLRGPRMSLSRRDHAFPPNRRFPRTPCRPGEEEELVSFRLGSFPRTCVLHLL